MMRALVCCLLAGVIGISVAPVTRAAVGGLPAAVDHADSSPEVGVTRIEPSSVQVRIISGKP